MSTPPSDEQREVCGWNIKWGMESRKRVSRRSGIWGQTSPAAPLSRRLDSILRAAGSPQSFEQGRHAEIALKQASFLRQQDRPCVGKHQDCVGAC